jgi:hypothetical protein
MTDQGWTVRPGPVPALLWPDDENPDMPFSLTEGDLAAMLPDALDRQVAAAFAAMRDALARGAQAGCHAITGDDGTTYCPLAEANMRAVARDAQVQAEMQNVDCGVIAEHPCAGPCLGCGAGPDESCSGGCRCDEGEDCAISVLLEADRVPLRRIAAIHGLYPSPGDRDDSEEQR